MLRIRFGKSPSSLYPAAVEIAESFGDNYTYNSKTKITEVYISNKEIFTQYHSILELYGIIYNWKSASFKLDEIDLRKTDFDMIKSLRECYKVYEDAPYQKHCYIDSEHFGWGCKYLNPVRLYLHHEDQRKPDSDYWYEYGHFEDNVWIVDKDRIRLQLDKHIENYLIFLCPAWSDERIDKVLEKIPDSIDLDKTENWDIIYEEVDTGFSSEK